VDGLLRSYEDATKLESAEPSFNVKSASSTAGVGIESRTYGPSSADKGIGHEAKHVWKSIKKDVQKVAGRVAYLGVPDGRWSASGGAAISEGAGRRTGWVYQLVEPFVQ
jgi:hypothetical protein